MHKIPLKNIGQSTLETTITLIVIVVLLLGITNVFVWMNKMMVERHQAFRATQFDSSPTINFYQPKKLDIFKGEE
jgi:hypothetical protein